jgi:UDP-N-acetylmuramate dehydrogenase
MLSDLAIQTEFSLRRFNTFGIDCKARTYLSVTSAGCLAALRNDAALSAMPRLVLGGGSNIVLTGDYDGLVLHMCNRGIDILDADEDVTYVRAAAGESWHGFVEWTLAHGLNGLENLSLIPGSVGAAPIQNIGAYGVEVKDAIESLRYVDLDSGAIEALANADCAFGYRDSVFKHRLRDRCVILDVTFRFPKAWRPNLGYADVAQELAAQGIAAPTARDIGAAVVAIRTRKLPDPAVIGNAGSFFKNPIVAAAQRDALLAQHPQLVSYAQPDGSFKLAAGWLIDQCGWKGRTLGAAGVYPKQALVLVNNGGASGRDIVALAEAIQRDVLERFGVRLEPEPVFV